MEKITDKKLYVLPEIAVIDQDFKDIFVISIVSPGREHPKMKGSNIHKFQFHDIDREYFLENQNRIIRPMEKEIAESIAELAMNNRDCDRWIIHCEAGISRSPGVAIGLAKHIALKPNRQQLKDLFPLYNKYVCQLVEDAMRAQVDEITKGLDTDWI
jgi:predicted protein tyrosine phosphatase